MIGERASSVAVGTALTLAISGVLVTGLLLGSASLLDLQEERAADDQVSDIGSDAVNYLHSFDRLNETGDRVNATAAPNYPDRIVDSYNYNLHLEDGSTSTTLRVHVPTLNLEREYRIDLDTEVRNSTVSGASFEANLCGNDGELALGGCEQ